MAKPGDVKVIKGFALMLQTTLSCRRSLGEDQITEQKPRSDDARVRRNAAIGLGKMGQGPQAVAQLARCRLVMGNLMHGTSIVDHVVQLASVTASASLAEVCKATTQASPTSMRRPMCCSSHHQAIIIIIGS